MKRYNLGFGILFLPVFLVLFVGTAGAQEKMRTLELVFRVQELAFRVQDLVFRGEEVGGRVEDLQMKETPTEIHIELSADVLFDFDKAEIQPKAQEALKQVAKVIREKAKGVVHIEGHTDAKGSEAYNQKLSERRANAVRDWLVSKEGLNKANFATSGLGSSKPVAPNKKPDGSDNPEGRQKNRRVEIVVKK
jgi:outer membrane protein OmpA-like peptidoglycan-associated protein